MTAADLEKELEKAVKAEDFEKAAKLRDRIKELVNLIRRKSA